VEDQSPDAHERVRVRGLWVRFGSVEAVRGIDIAAYAGRATALLGRNGAGKSTTMRVLAGVIPPSEGVVLVDGVDVRVDPLTVKRSTGYCPDVGGLVPRATPWEHLQLAARLRRMEGWETRAQELLERFELGDAAHRVTGGFSHGMGRRLSVVLAAFHEPGVLLLDEPFEGLAPIIVHDLLAVCERLAAEGQAIIIVEQNIAAALSIASRAYILNNGHVVYEGSSAELKDSHEILERYVGV
jgi:ABC-2 type transport system ATP-binding protein